MANNFYNAVRRNISADSNLPTIIYTVPNSKKSIAIELDCSNKSSAGVTVTVQLEDESQNESGGNGQAISAVAQDATGLLTTTSNTNHNLIVNDRVIFSATAAPSFTNASLPPSAEAALSVTRFYYVQSVTTSAPYKFTIAETKSAASALSFDTAGNTVAFTKIHLADIIKDAPIPVGGTLKVISGQKLVLESHAANINDKIYAYSSGASAVDVITSVLEDVS